MHATKASPVITERRLQLERFVDIKMATTKVTLDDNPALIAACQTQLGWGEAYANRVFAEYLKFLHLKGRLSDYVDDAATPMKLAPSPTIDKMWRQHILDTRRYRDDCNALCGRTIHYDPTNLLEGDSAPGDDAKWLKRVRTTKRAYTLVYGTRLSTSEIWDFGSFSKKKRGGNRDSVLLDEGNDELQPCQEADITVVTIGVRDTFGKTTWFKLPEHAKMQKVFERFSQRMGVKESTLKLSLSGDTEEGEGSAEDDSAASCPAIYDYHTIDDNLTPAMLHLSGGEIFDARPGSSE
jgi:hypothetical protein